MYVRIKPRIWIFFENAFAWLPALKESKPDYKTFAELADPISFVRIFIAYIAFRLKMTSLFNRFIQMTLGLKTNLLPTFY